MPIYDFECTNPDCKNVSEHVVNLGTSEVSCPACGSPAAKIFSPMGAGTFNEDAAWIRSVLEVVAKDSTKPYTQEFLRRPTRANMQRWMRAEGIRHVEDGEKPARFDHDADHRRRTEYAERRHFERKSITVRGG